MSELVGMSFDADASPTVRFESPGGEGAASVPGAIYGWGVGWYPSSDRGASVVKDPTSSGASSVSNALGDWNRFRSTLFICHMRGHRRPRNQEDAQPFVRSYGGRQWIFAHDGDLADDWESRLPLGDDPAFEPLGRTDSEHAFCWLLAKLRAQRARSLADLPPDSLQAWMRELNLGGQLNALLTDGQHIAAYRDAGGLGSLHWSRRIPPHENTELSSDAVHIALNAPEDPNRTLLVFSSVPLSDGPWQEIGAGNLIVARRGSILWSSDPAGESRPVFRSVTTAAPTQFETGQQAPSSAPLLSPNGGAQLTPVAFRTFQITHETHYQYAEPVDKSSHRLLLRPLEDRWQELLAYDLQVNPSVDWLDYEDVFGNDALALDFNAPYQSMSIASHSTVRVEATPPLERRVSESRHAIPLAWMPWQRTMLSAYLMPPELPESQLQELSEFAMGFVERNDYDLVGTLLDMNQTIYRDFEYVSGSTTNETNAFDVFGSRRGVCQDFANLMICLARLLQIPARYRMGYIFTGANYSNKIQSDASHAWVELYVPRVGWHGFDPTNGIQVGADHVRVACGRNYRDATPTSGTIYRGGGTETLTISVRVESAEP